MNIAFFGSSLISAYWNGAATYYRGIVHGLASLGHRVTFYEPDAFGRQQHRDIENPKWAHVVVYGCDRVSDVERVVEESKSNDLIIKASGVGVFDEYLEAAIAALRGPRTGIVFWDVDAPATLARLKENALDPFHDLIPKYDLILTYGGGRPVIEGYLRRGAKDCIPIYNAYDPETHHPVCTDPAYTASLGFLGNRLPDREARVGEFFFKAAELLPEETFILGGNGWSDSCPALDNVRYLGHVFTQHHNAFNCSSKAVLNVNRESMAKFGFSPATRVFEAAGAGACLITDAWEGIERFLEPGKEILVAESGDEVVEILRSLTWAQSRRVGNAARLRMEREHTYSHRAIQLQKVLDMFSLTQSMRARSGVDPLSPAR